jgi:excisionase family DNA binding protein
VAGQQKLSTKSVGKPWSSARLGRSRPSTAALAHLVGMKSPTHSETGPGPVVTLSELASQLGVSLQTLYDLRSQGRGPRGFRVGRELRFRVSEVEAWLAQMEADDAERHPRQAG